VATRDASDRLLPSHVFVPAPALRRFSTRHALARLRDRGDRLPHIRAIRFGGPHVAHRAVSVVGVVFPPRCVRAKPLTPLSPPPRQHTSARAHVPPRRPPRPPPSRPCERCVLTIRSEVPSIGREPSPRDALSNARLRSSPTPQLCHRDAGCRCLFTRPEPFGSEWAGPPSTRPVANGTHASLGLGVARRLLQLKRRAGTPYERSILARE